MSQYQVIVFDLDGTAIPNVPNGLPSERLVQTIADAQSSIKLCAATGRPITNAYPILEKLNLTNPCVISAGTQIINPQTHEILWEVQLDPGTVAKILAIFSPYPYEVLMREELQGFGKPAHKLTTRDDVNVVYIMGCSEADAVIILEQLALIPNITASGVTSWTQQGVDIHITHRNATKEHAIAKLLELLNIPKENSIGVGDANNDVHLFKAVSHKIAMGNATELLKSQANEICDTVDNDGLVEIIKKYTQ